MKVKETEYTEVLHKEITPKGREHWRKIKNAAIKRLYPYIIMNVLLIFVQMGALFACTYALQNFMSGVQDTGAIDYRIVLIILAAMAGYGVTVYFGNYVAQKTYLNGEKILSVTLYRDALKNQEYLQKVQTGDAINILGRDAVRVGMNLALRRIYFTSGIIQTVAVLGIIYYYSWVVGVAVTVFYPLYYLINGLIMSFLSKKEYLCSQAYAVNSQVRLKGVEGWLELAILKKQDFYSDKYAKAFNESFRRDLSCCKVSALQLLVRVLAAYALPVLCVIACTMPILWGQAVPVSVMLIVYMMAGY